MGLDMYLYAEVDLPVNNEIMDILELNKPRYGWWDETGENEFGGPVPEAEGYYGRWSHCADEEKAAADAIITKADLTNLVAPESTSLTVIIHEDTVSVRLTVAYWRKANSVHNWFVNQVQNGVDECQLSPCSPEQLGILKRTVTEALALYKEDDKKGAEELLTPTSGFFFGGTQVDEWWVADMKNTIEQLQFIEDAEIASPVKYYYRSSW